MIKLFLICLLCVKAFGSKEGHNWNYENEGPDFWREEFKNCKGQKQSPIDISKDFLEYDSNLKPFNFYNYDKLSNWNVSHNGHTVVAANINDDNSHKFSVDGSDFNQKFNLLQFHFHWGYNNYQGSEHMIDGEKFPLEMHLVHKSNDGNFTVLGFLFQLSNENNTGLNSLLNAVKLAKGKGQWQNASFSLESILPDLSTLDYYRYSGSLTTPPCTEGVIWNVFTSYINISAVQLNAFRKNSLKLNFRDPQKIYNRQVFTSFEVSNQISRSKGIECSSINSSSKNLNFSNSILSKIFIIFNLALIKFF